MSSFLQDLRFSLRSFARSPGYALVAVITLALGIGANTAIFSVVDTVILRALPYPDPGALVDAQFIHRGEHGAISIPDYHDWREQARSFSALAAWHDDSAVLTGRARPVHLDSAVSSANMFRALGVQPALGRGFLDEEEVVGRNHVVVLSHAAWVEHFAADPGVIGSTITLDDTPHTIVGVLPADFRFVGPGSDPAIWQPMPHPSDVRMATQRGAHYLWVIGRLAPGVTVAQARAELETIGARLATLYPQTNAASTVRVMPLQDSLVAKVRPALLVLLAAVGFVLLIACANVASILLARATVRQRELAVRVALGASRARIVRQLLTESLVLALVGGALGVLLAIWGLDELRSLLPDSLSRLHAIGVDGRVLLFTVGVSLATGVVFGLAPALHAARANPNDALKEAARTAASGWQRGRAALVATEVAAAMLLLVGAGLMLRSFWRLAAVEPGFDPQNVTYAWLNVPDARYDTDAKLATLFRGLREHLTAIPGVEDAGLMISVPFSGNNLSLTVDIVGAPPMPPGQERVAAFNIATAGSFRTLRIPLRAGRLYTDAEDRLDGPLYAVVSESFARRFFPDGDALGKKISMGWHGNKNPREIIGIVGDIHDRALEREPGPVMYFPMSQAPSSFFSIVVRTSATAGIADALRTAVAAVDPDQPIAEVMPLSQVMRLTGAQRRLNTLLLGIFAAVALALALVGVYGVMSYNVTQRVREIGVRLALGARPVDVTRMVVRHGVAVALVGVAAGVALTLPLARLMAGMLYGVGATDPPTYAVIAAALVLVAALASWVPARRAARVDPMVALRAE